MKERVSVIVPTYNREKTIDRAIQSILKQTYTEYEIVIVDDGSTDHTEEIVGRMEDVRIRYVRLEKNQGAAHARNEGIHRSSCDYIAFLDSDDVWLPDKLELQMDKMIKSAENVGLVYCRMKRPGENGVICPAYDWPEDVPLEGNLFPLLLWRNIIGTPSMLVKRACLESVGGFRETLHCIEDWELILRIAKNWQIGFVDRILVEVNKSENSVSSNAGSFLLTRCYMASLYRREMTEMGLRTVVEQEIMDKARLYGLEEETRELLDKDFSL